jgi:serine/threonine-protein kinase
MAAVYEAEDSVLGRRVALKVLHNRYVQDASFQRRFRQEARAMASLDHENIIKIYDISREGEVPFIVAEYVNGRGLNKLLEEQGRLDERSARRIGAQVLRALSYAHRRGIVHRDIKPSNTLICSDGTVKVGDFGIARIMEDEKGDDPGEVVGSARYISPEQLRGEGASPRSDLYSVGVLIYHCLTGRTPFDGDVETISRSQLRESPEPLSKLNRGVPKQLEAVVMKALSKDPANRHPSANAMLDDLRPAPHATAAGETQQVHRGSRPDATSGRVRRGLVVLSTLVLLLLGGGGAALGFGMLGSSGGGPENNNAFDAARPMVESTTLQEPRETQQQTNPVEATPQQQTTPAETTPHQQERYVSPSTREQTTSRQMVQVPEVAPYFDYVARGRLNNIGLIARVVYRYKQGYQNRGVSWGTNPPVGAVVPEGTTVTVYATPKTQPQY